MTAEDAERDHQPFDHVGREHLFELPQVGRFRPAKGAGVPGVDIAQVNDFPPVKFQPVCRNHDPLFASFLLLEESLFFGVHAGGRLHDHRPLVGYGIEDLLPVILFQLLQVCRRKDCIGNGQVARQQLDVGDHIPFRHGADAGHGFEVGGRLAQDVDLVAAHRRSGFEFIGHDQFTQGHARVDAAHLALPPDAHDLIGEARFQSYQFAQFAGAFPQRQQDGGPDPVVEKAPGKGLEGIIEADGVPEYASGHGRRPFHQPAGVDEEVIEFAKGHLL